MVAIVTSSQSYSFSSSHVLMWELNHKEGWAINKWCFWTVLLEMTLESPLDGKMSKSVNLKGNQPWMFIRRLMMKPKIQYFGRLKWRALRESPWCCKDWGHEEKGTTEGKKIGRQNHLNGQEFEQAVGDREGQGSKVCCSSWGYKESDMTEQLNYNNIT